MTHKIYSDNEKEIRMNSLNKLMLAFASFYLRSSKLDFGRWRLNHHFLPMLRKGGSLMGERVVSTHYGFRYKADLGDWLGQYVYLTGVYEPPTAHVISTLLSPGDTFIDVGANSGFFTLLASNQVGPTGRVLSFEPLPSMRRRIMENISLNGMENVTLYGAALSNTVGEVTFYEGPQGHKGISSMRPIGETSAILQVPTMPLDNLADKIPSIKLIKIDVEGAEQLVIEGMERLLAQHHPYLVIEITDQYLKPFGHSAQGLSNLLCSMGYRMYKITPQSIVEMSPDKADSELQYNALFSKKPLDPLLTEVLMPH
jgi:FkbM family methyltransferase